MEMNNSLTTIISDFDGTILKNGAMEMDPVFLDILEQVMERGIHFIAASGRQYANLQYLMGRLADRVSYVCENGALAFSGGEMIHQAVVAPADLQEVIADLEQEPYTMIVPCSATTDYVLKKDVWMQNYLGKVMKSNYTVVEDFTAFDEDIIKLSIYWEKGVDREKSRSFRAKYGSRLHVMDSGNNWLDFTSPEANKAVALKKMAEKEGFLLTETVSFGDNENDMLMLQSTGMSYVMTTAKDEVKTAAKRECSDVGEVLKELFL
jgi:Cof subfamily protein (haloacid dehalogenase superfamily)